MDEEEEQLRKALAYLKAQSKISHQLTTNIRPPELLAGTT